MKIGAKAWAPSPNMSKLYENDAIRMRNIFESGKPHYVRHRLIVFHIAITSFAHFGAHDPGAKC